MRQAVNDVYRHQLGLPAEWTPQQRELFIDLVTDRLDGQAAALAMQLGENAIRRWRDIHGGQYPDHATTVGLHATAMQNAREAIVREELYALIPQRSEDQQPHPPGPPVVQGVPWENRWRDLRYRTPPSEAIEELAHHVWAERTPMFRVAAAYLLAARAEEGRRVPRGPRHPLARRLALLIEEELHAYGYVA